VSRTKKPDRPIARRALLKLAALLLFLLITAANLWLVATAFA